jgi:hypothetical protein
MQLLRTWDKRPANWDKFLATLVANRIVGLFIEPRYDGRDMPLLRATL